MKTISRLIAAAAFMMLVGGCAGDLGNIGTAIQVATTGVQNPLTKKEYSVALRTYKAALNPTVAYLELRTCKLNESELASWASPSACANYDRKLAAQNALRVAAQYRAQLRDFVRQNNMVDARVAYNELMKAIAIMRSYKKGAAQ